MKKYILILLIFLFALFLRVYKLGQYPVGFLWDEAALGYNAYSILQTGRDEYGKFFPVVFKSFGDYKPGLYIYLTIPSVFLFGLNEFAVRLPSAIFGSLTIVFLYLLLEELRRFNRTFRTADSFLPICTAIVLTISPWHLNFSRGAWELNVMVFEVILGFFLLFKFLNSKKRALVFLSALSFALTFFTYQTAKLLTPMSLLGFLIFFRKEIKSVSFRLKSEFVAIILFGFLSISLLTLLGNMSGRLKVMSVFSYPRSEEETNLILKEDNQNKVLWGLFHSSPIFFTRSILGRYFNYFSGKYLFFMGDWSNARNSTVYQGVAYYPDLLFLLLGLGILFRRKRNPFENFMFFWLVVSPLPAALTRDNISSVRSFTMVIPLVYIIAVGMSGMLGRFDKFSSTHKFILYSLFFILYSLFFVRFLDLYFLHDPLFSSESRLYGYKEMINYLLPQMNGKNKVIITSSFGQPYIFYLFCSKYDPGRYQKNAKLKEDPQGDVGEVERIENIEFRKIYWPDDRGNINSLFVGNEFELPLKDIIGQERINFLKEIKFLNGKTAFRIVKTE